MIEFIVGTVLPNHPSFKANLYGLARREAEKFAESINREVAEGPPLYLPDNYYGPVELWPLVWEGE